MVEPEAQAQAQPAPVWALAALLVALLSVLVRPPSVASLLLGILLGAGALCCAQARRGCDTRYTPRLTRTLLAGARRCCCLVCSRARLWLRSKSLPRLQWWRRRRCLAVLWATRTRAASSPPSAAGSGCAQPPRRPSSRARRRVSTQRSGARRRAGSARATAPSCVAKLLHSPLFGSPQLRLPFGGTPGAGFGARRRAAGERGPPRL